MLTDVSSKCVVVIALPSLVTLGGLENFTVNLAQWLKDLGCVVHLVTTHEKGALVDRLCAEIECHDLSHISNSISKIRQFAYLIQKINPDVLVSSFSGTANFSHILLKSSIKTACVIHCDDPEYYRVASIMPSKVWRWIAPTPKLADELSLRLDARDASRVRTLPHGIDAQLFRCVKGPPFKQTKQIVFVGSILPHKGVDLLPDIMALLVASGLQVHLTIIGEGISKFDISERFDLRQVSHLVAFAGRVAPDRMPNFLKDKDILILPTRGEGFGLVIAEAMMCGVVPVVTRLPRVTDFIIEDHFNGVLADMESAESFASAIRFLYESPDEWAKMVKNGLATANLRFSGRQMAKDYLTLFTEADDRTEDAGTCVQWKTLRIFIVGFLSKLASMGVIRFAARVRTSLFRKLRPLWTYVKEQIS